MKQHPLHQFKFCPVCGQPTFVIHNEKAKECTHCGFVYYFNPSSAVACFIRNEAGELLLVRRAKDPGKGTLDLPGGFVDMYESAEEAAAREVKEETGLQIDHCEYLFSIPNIYPYKGFEVHTVDMFFECHVKQFTRHRQPTMQPKSSFASQPRYNPKNSVLLPSGKLSGNIRK